jgi:response regulator RpfG family c-di-GMP phosphodiesterase
LALVQQSLADGRPYAVAFIDICMPPGWSGIETLERIWEIDPDIQVVICTAYGEHTLGEISNSKRRNDELILLKKPFEPSEVRTMASAMHHKWNLKRQAQGLDKKARSLQTAVTDLTSHRSELERVLAARTAAVEATRDVAVFALANLADSRDPETGEHLVRMRTYSHFRSPHELRDIITNDGTGWGIQME